MEADESCPSEDLLPALKAGPGSESLLCPDTPHPQAVFVMWWQWSATFLDSKNKEDFSFSVVWLSPSWWFFVSGMYKCVCDRETERPHTSEGGTDGLRGTEAVTQPLSPSQPREPVLRTDGELAEGGVVRAACTSVAAAGPRGRPRHPHPRAASTSRPHEDRRGP